MLKLIFSIEYRSYKLTIVVYMHVIYNFNHSLCILHMETTKKKRKKRNVGECSDFLQPEFAYTIAIPDKCF